MPREYGKLEAILQAVVDRLVSYSGLPEATEDNVYINIDPDAVTSNPGEFVFVVAPSGGQFDEAMMDGGGQAQMTAATNIVVKCHATGQFDQAGRAKEMLANSSTGLIVIHRKLLKALSIWDPTDSGNEQTRNPIMPGSWSYQRAGGGAGQGPRSYAAVEQVFVVDFDWDMRNIFGVDSGTALLFNGNYLQL